MKKLLTIFTILLLSIATSGCFRSGQKSKALDNRSSTMIDSLSYAMGIDFGNVVYDFFYVGNELEMNLDMIYQGIKDVFNDKQAMTVEEGQDFVTYFFNVYLPKENLKKANEYLCAAQNGNPNLKSTESGLLYEIIESGDMDIRVVDNFDQVVISYIGTLVNGKEFDRQENAILYLTYVIKGWSEGLKLIGKGGKIKLIVPPDLGYGAYGNRDIIPANAVMIYDIELLDVINYEEEEKGY